MSSSCRCQQRPTSSLPNAKVFSRASVRFAPLQASKSAPLAPRASGNLPRTQHRVRRARRARQARRWRPRRAQLASIAPPGDPQTEPLVLRPALTVRQAAFSPREARPAVSHAARVWLHVAVPRRASIVCPLFPTALFTAPMCWHGGAQVDQRTQGSPMSSFPLTTRKMVSRVPVSRSWRLV